MNCQLKADVDQCCIKVGPALQTLANIITTSGHHPGLVKRRLRPMLILFRSSIANTKTTSGICLVFAGPAMLGSPQHVHMSQLSYWSCRRGFMFTSKVYGWFTCQAILTQARAKLYRKC